MRSVKQNKSPKWKIIGLSLAIIGLSGVLFWQSPYYGELEKSVRESYELLMNKSSLVLGQVIVEGHSRTSLSDINREINLAQGTPIPDIPMEQIRQKLLNLPWIKSVVIERHLPGTLYIRLTEKEPIAIWQHHQKYLPLDTEGHPVQDTQTALPNLVLVVGEGAPEQTPALLEILDRYPDIRRQVRSAVRVSRRRWNLMLNDAENGVVIKLPETEIEEALARLSRAAETEKIFKKDLSMIDLRQKDRLIVRPKERKK